MKLSTKPPSGMRDFLPMVVFRRQYVVDVIRRVYERYGFVPIETPTIENLSTLLGKYGEEGDQLLYRILHRRDALDRALAENPSQETLADEGLRYDLTVPLARVVAQYNLPKFFRRYQIQPVWRADRPGKGRFREFYQCDIDITGTSGVFAEVEVCSAIAEALHALGFADFQIQVNHRQFLRKILQVAGIDLQHEARVLGVLDKLEKIGETQVREELLLQGVAASSIQLLMDQVLGTLSAASSSPYCRYSTQRQRDPTWSHAQALSEALGTTRVRSLRLWYRTWRVAWVAAAAMTT